MYLLSMVWIPLVCEHLTNIIELTSHHLYKLLWSLFSKKRETEAQRALAQDYATTSRKAQQLRFSSWFTLWSCFYPVLQLNLMLISIHTSLKPTKNLKPVVWSLEDLRFLQVLTIMKVLKYLNITHNLANSVKCFYTRHFLWVESVLYD